ncbi:cell division protein FtsL [Brackiella oedipodis]|uniref:cell division protein FtsL n=1 Tax=Brackiella oedipodis TaxID=124225 RepID=UPI00048AF237|nr:cell division protein FtsL [Brackiella oedipodis]
MSKLVLFSLIALFLYSAVTLVTVRYEQRQLYIDIEREAKSTKKLQTDWRFLELQRANLTNTMSVNKVVTEKLDMQAPSVNDILYLPESELAPVEHLKPQVKGN